MNEYTDTTIARQRHQEALRNAAGAYQLELERRPLSASLAAALRGLADRIEPGQQPGPEPAELVHA